jgi:hypothetical protein
MKTNINYEGVPLVVDFKFEGKFYPATRDTPAEYPEVLINSIYVEDSEIDVQGMLHWKQIEEIENLINE